MSEQDDFPERFHRERREHGGASQHLDDDRLARLTEEERVAAGLDAYRRHPYRRRQSRIAVRWRAPSTGAVATAQLLPGLVAEPGQAFGLAQHGEHLEDPR